MQQTILLLRIILLPGQKNSQTRVVKLLSSIGIVDGNQVHGTNGQRKLWVTMIRARSGVDIMMYFKGKSFASGVVPSAP